MGASSVIRAAGPSSDNATGTEVVQHAAGHAGILTLYRLVF
jgi:hypothetical protein